VRAHRNISVHQAVYVVDEVGRAARRDHSRRPMEDDPAEEIPPGNILWFLPADLWFLPAEKH
jgi:hypothetical protein